MRLIVKIIRPHMGPGYSKTAVVNVMIKLFQTLQTRMQVTTIPCFVIWLKFLKYNKSVNYYGIYIKAVTKKDLLHI